jgi:hypothetical protein
MSKKDTSHVWAGARAYRVSAHYSYARKAAAGGLLAAQTAPSSEGRQVLCNAGFGSHVGQAAAKGCLPDVIDRASRDAASGSCDGR